MALLSDAEVRHYQEQGFLVPSFRLDPPLVDRLREARDKSELDRFMEDRARGTVALTAAPADIARTGEY